jgi:hypothetical protein
MTPLHIFMIGRRGDRNCQRLAGDGKRLDGAVDRNSLDARPADAVGAALNSSLSLFDKAGACTDPKDAQPLLSVAEQVVEFAMMRTSP